MQRMTRDLFTEDEAPPFMLTEDGTVSAREYPAYSSVSDSTGVQFRRTANVGHRGASSQLTYAPRLVSEQAGLCRPVGVVSDGSLMRSQGRERRRR
ncbi:hypothetical protein MRX96_042939 [Rhipicephalus microplus]